MRGLVMMLMAVDHSDALISTERHIRANSWLAEQADGILAAPVLVRDAFLTRLATHVCAPTFLFLAGVAIALSGARRRAQGAGPFAIGGHLFARGAVLVVLELTVMRWIWGEPMTLLLVLYAIGGSMMAMAFLRVLPAAAVTAVGAALIVGAEPAIEALGGFSVTPPLWQAALLSGGLHFGDAPANAPPSVVVFYPIASWLGVMCLGFGLGHRIRRRAPMVPWLLFWGVVGVLAFGALRWWGGVGEMNYPRRDGTWQQWLNASKYPPSLSFLSGTLGVACLLLAGLWIVQSQRVWRQRVWRSNPLLVLGQVPLFFYLIHIPVLWALDTWVPDRILPPNTMRGTWLGAGLCILALWPVCGLYRWYKQKWRHAWTHYL